MTVTEFLSHADPHGLTTGTDVERLLKVAIYLEWLRRYDRTGNVETFERLLLASLSSATLAEIGLDHLEEDRA
jgi:hypothetical protein